MSEEGAIVVAKPKDGGGAASITCPMLTSTNYTFWAMRMRSILRVNKVWETIDAVQIEDEEKNDLAIALLFESIPENLVLQVGELDTAKKVWDAIKSQHVGAERVRDARLQTLMSNFDKLKMKDSENIDEFVKRMTYISSKSKALGTNIEGSKMVKKFLKCLPRKKYIQIVASLEQVLDLNNTSFEDIVGRLKAYEERILEDEDSQEQQEEQTKLMYANSDGPTNSSNSSNQQEYSGNYKGNYRGRGGRFMNRGRGRGRYGGRGIDFSQVTCFRCDKSGHFASHCPDRILKLQEAQETEKGTEEADELMLNEVVFLNEKHCVPSKFETSADKEDIWYLDNGASNHMTGDIRYFDSLDSTITGKVRFGDDSRIDIKGKGTIAFIDLQGKARKMTDVYYIPGLRSNIVSLGQAT